MRHLRFAVAVTVVLIAVSFPPPGLADSVALVSVSPASSSVNVGTSLTVDVDISNVTDLYALQFDLSFAPGVLSAVSITEGSFLSSGGPTFFIPGTIDNTSGSITFTADTLLGSGPGASNMGTLAVLTLSGLSPGSSGIDLSNVLLLDSNLNPISFDLQSAGIAVVPAVATPEPSSLSLIFAAAGILIFFRRK